MSDEASGQPRLLDQVRQTLRVGHSSIHTERACVDWIVRFVRFHGMRSREDLFPGEAKIEALLTHLATAGGVAAATQNQAMNALVFLYVATTMIYTQVLQLGGHGVRSPLDDL